MGEEPLVLEYVLDGAVILLVAAVGWLIRTVITTSRRVSTLESLEQSEKLRDDVTDLNSRVAVLEAREQSEAIRGEIGDVHKRVDQVAATVNNIDGQMKQSNKTLGLILEQMMKGGGDDQ